MATYTRVASVTDFPPGHMRGMRIDGDPVVVVNVDGVFYAIGGACTHDEAPLEEGELEGTRLTCPWHFSVFDVVSGEVLESPAAHGVRTYEVRTEDDWVLVGPARSQVQG